MVLAKGQYSVAKLIEMVRVYCRDAELFVGNAAAGLLLHYRTAALMSASPQLAESIRAAKRFRVVPQGDICTAAKTVPIRSPRRRGL
jgi:hypothetical protein